MLLFSTAYATTYYTYDILGRVTQVVESDGTTTQYSYDANGNVTSITRTSGTSVLSIGSVSASSGAVGSSITINGSGFSSISGQDVVTIDGVAAQVTYASDNRLVITVPTGATTGNIAITTQNGSISRVARLPSFRCRSPRSPRLTVPRARSLRSTEGVSTRAPPISLCPLPATQ